MQAKLSETDQGECRVQEETDRGLKEDSGADQRL